MPDARQDQFGYALRKQFPADSISEPKAACEAEGPDPSNTAYGWVAG